MAYGTLSATIANNYNKVKYTLNDGTSYDSLSIFKTNPSTMSIAPCCRSIGNKQAMEDMIPNGVDASKVVAKCTASPMENYLTTGATFYGLYYTNNKELWSSGYKLTGASQFSGVADNWFPAFCIKTDGTANIRWFTSSANLQDALPYCSAIIAGSAPLVYDSKSVFETTAVNSLYDAKLRIADWNNINSTSCHFKNANCGDTAKVKVNRTFLGHKPDGSFVMVCADLCTMDLQVGARLMCDLGCDYAINEDGSRATKMRVASGYSGNYAAGQMTVGGTTIYGACVGAYLK